MDGLIPISQRQLLPSLASEEGTTLSRCEPATRAEGRSELGACLTLVAPSGMQPADRAEWLAVAMRTLSGIPADLLAEGCAVARKRCRFASEIVPTIMETVEARWQQRKAEARRSAVPIVQSQEHCSGPFVEAADIQNLIKQLGSKLGSGAAPPRS